MKKLGIWASGTMQSGGSGFVNMVRHLSPTAPGADPVLKAEIPVVVSQHKDGNVYRLAKELGIHFEHLPEPWTGSQEIFDHFKLDYAALSGFTKRIAGHDPRWWLNIHPATIELTRGLHGIAPHERMIELYRAGTVTHTEVVMHFATAEYDSPDGVFFRRLVRIIDDPALSVRESAQALQKRVGVIEHLVQPFVTQMVLDSLISWDGKDPASLRGQLFT